MSEKTIREDPAILFRGWFSKDIENPLQHLVGGPARLKVIVVLACVLGLEAADKATVGAVAGQLIHSLHIGYVEIGLLVSASTIMAAIVTLPFGILVDKVQRTRLLVITIAVWSLVQAISGASNSYTMLLLSRLALGAVVAVASPAVASLTGDFFLPRERGRIFGYILGGQLVGVAFGFMLSGNIAALLSWRVSFWALAALGGILALVIWRFLPEPARGGQSIVPIGATEVPSAEEAKAGDVPPPQGNDEEDEVDIEEEIEEQHIAAHKSLVLDRDPADLSLWHVVRYVLSIRTYRTLIIASALGYFYFTGLRTFAIVFMRGRFDLSQAAATTVSVVIGLGAIVGVLLVGRGGDALIHRGKLAGRVWMGAAAYLLATAAFLPGMLSHSLFIAGGLFFIGAAGIGGANPAVDAARLDVMHFRLWGRAEGVRATLRYLLEAIAPPLFGYVATWFGSSHGVFGATHGHGTSGGAGLGQAFLVMLVPLAIAGLILIFRTAKTYPRDVATAIASEQATREE